MRSLIKPLAFPLVALIVLTLVAGRPLARAQSPRPVQTSPGPQKAPNLIATVERAGDQVRLVLTNSGETSAFQGTASISVDGSADAVARLSFTLAPQETRSLLLPGNAPLGNQYVLSIHDQAGRLVLYKSAPLALADRGVIETVAGRMAPLNASNDIRVNARLPRHLSNSEAEIPMPEEADLSLLIVVIDSPTPIRGASFTLSGGDFERRQPVAVQGHTEIEFKLPVELSERKFNYTLTAGDGSSLAKGKIDLDQLSAPDLVSISELTFDRPVYAPGEAARVVIELQGELQGETPRGYRLEVIAKEGETNLFKDARKGVTLAGKSRQEFLFDLPREVKGPLTFTFRVFGGQTGLLFDSGTRQIILNEAPPAKTGDSKRLVP